MARHGKCLILVFLICLGQQGVNERRVDEDGTKVPVATIVGPVVGVLVLAAIIAVSCFVYRKRRHGSKPTMGTNEFVYVNQSMAKTGSANDDVNSQSTDPEKADPNLYANVGVAFYDNNRPGPTATHGNYYTDLPEHSRGSPNDEYDYSELPGTATLYTSLDESNREQKDKGNDVYNIPTQQPVEDGENSYFTNVEARLDADQHVYTSLDVTKL